MSERPKGRSGLMENSGELPQCSLQRLDLQSECTAAERCNGALHD